MSFGRNWGYKRMIIDAHQHLWVISELEYPWITPDLTALKRDFKAEDYLNVSKDCKIDGTVLVQSADSYEDTFYMFDVAKRYDFVKGVVGWIPFDRPNEARAALDVLSSNKILKGLRNLTHDYSNPKYSSDDSWILRPNVLETLNLISDRGLTLDYVAVNGHHLQNIIKIAYEIPSLKIVIDHLGKPNIAGGEIDSWSSLIKMGSQCPNLYLKLSGLNTASNKGWKISDWKPYFEVAHKAFGPNRLMIGGDWPVIELFDSFEKVWNAQLDLIDHLTAEEKLSILGGNSIKFYGLKEEK